MEPLINRGTPFNRNWKFIPYGSRSRFNSMVRRPTRFSVRSSSFSFAVSTADTVYRGWRSLPDSSRVHHSSGFSISNTASVPFSVSTVPSGQVTCKVQVQSPYCSTWALAVITAPSPCSCWRTESCATRAVSTKSSPISSVIPLTGSTGPQSQPKWHWGLRIWTMPFCPLEFIGVIHFLYAALTYSTGE